MLSSEIQAARAHCSTDLDINWHVNSEPRTQTDSSLSPELPCLPPNAERVALYTGTPPVPRSHSFLPSGCPIDLVCDKSAGSSLLLKPKKIEEIARSMSRSMSIPLTLKTRKGYYDGNDVSEKFDW